MHCPIYAGFVQQFKLLYSILAHPVPFLFYTQQLTLGHLHKIISVCVCDAKAVRRSKPLLYQTPRTNNIPGAQTADQRDSKLHFMSGLAVD